MLPKLGFEVVTRLLNPHARGLEFTRSIYSGVIWELLMLKKKNFIWSSKLTHLSINFMSFCLIRGSQDTASEGFAYQPTSFQLCILYICICACVCMCVCWHFNARKIHLLQDVMYILNGRSVLIFSYF